MTFNLPRRHSDFEDTTFCSRKGGTGMEWRKFRSGRFVRRPGYPVIYGCRNRKLLFLLVLFI